MAAAVAGEVIGVCTSDRKGIPKTNVGRGTLVGGVGLAGDAHNEPGDRMLSLLAMESIQKMVDLGLDVTIGSFAENITTSGIFLPSLPIGTTLRIGEQCLVQITIIGKTCHKKCAIYYKAGDCIMPREGIFAKILAGGPVAVGDKVEVVG